MNIASLEEFKWRYPILIEELVRRHDFENQINEDDLKEDIDLSKLTKESNEITNTKYIFNLLEDYIGINYCLRYKISHKKQGSLNKAYFIASKKYGQVNRVPYYYSYFPFHTWIGGLVFLISISWFIWCLNYLLLFASYHTTDISDSILTSFGLSELQTLFIIQPISIIILIFFSYLLNKINHYFSRNQHKIPSIYYFSDPYIKQHSTIFSTNFSFELFTNIPAHISYSLLNHSSKIKNLGYASTQSVVDYIEGDKIYKLSDYDIKLDNLYNKMNSLKRNIVFEINKLYHPKKNNNII